MHQTGINTDRSALKRLFLGECLEAWKTEFMFCHWLNEVRGQSTDPGIKLITAYITTIAERHTAVLSSFLPEIHAEIAESAAIFESVSRYPNRVNIAAPAAAAAGKDGFLLTLMDVMQQCQRLYESLALEAMLFNYANVTTVFSSIAGDYKKECISWSSAC